MAIGSGVCSRCGEQYGPAQKKYEGFWMSVRTPEGLAFVRYCNECGPVVKQEWADRIVAGESCTCSRCGQERGGYNWATGHVQPGKGLCESCFKIRVNAACEVRPVDLIPAAAGLHNIENGQASDEVIQQGLAAATSAVQLFAANALRRLGVEVSE